ncbi:Membrane steroid-binding protein 1 [Capsicum annuum]|nr:Membrane steroid-binding protein 1 [Capsicum annuum]
MNLKGRFWGRDAIKEKEKSHVDDVNLDEFPFLVNEMKVYFSNNEERLKRLGKKKLKQMNKKWIELKLEESELMVLPSPVQLGEISEEELKEYDGSDPNKPLLMAIKGQIYDVSQSRMFYGPGGPYALFAGKDASRALAKLSFEEKDLTGDISGLGAFELDAVPVNDREANDRFVEATDGAAQPAKADASGSAKPLEDGPSKGSEAANDAPSETVAAESVVKSEADVDKKD